jgi:hypothetical protein
MQVRLVFIERDFRDNDVASREEILCGESTKSLTRNHVAKLIARHHPELGHAGRVWLLDASGTAHKWYVGTERLGSNRWLTAYADPLPDEAIQI